MRTRPGPSKCGRQRQSLITQPRPSRSRTSRRACRNWSAPLKLRSRGGIGDRMKAALRSRLERLEVRVEPKKPPLFRSGYLQTLPADYVGERHVVIVKREPSGASGQNEWCEFEERPGPPPLDAQEN